MKYTQPQKAVAALLAMGKPDAAAVLARLSRDETDQLLASAREMRTVPQEDLIGIANEFEHAFDFSPAFSDADSSFHQLVSETVRNEVEPAADPVTNAEFGATNTFVFTAFDDATTDEIVEFLAEEDESVSACVLSRLAGDRPGEILQMLDDTRRSGIFMAMVSLGETSLTALQAIDRAATAFFSDKKAASNAGKLTGIARLLNSIDRGAAESAIASLQETFGEKDVSALRSMLFRFEDVVKLDPGSRSAVFDALPTDTITLALNDADEGLREAILSSISQRTRRIIENDLKSQTKVSQPAVRNAQKLVVSQILQMAAAGVLVLPSNELEAA